MKPLALRSMPFLAGTAILAWCLLFMVNVRPSGDENFYFGNAGHLSDFLKAPRSEEADDRRIVNQIVSQGWFPPGMSLVLLPTVLLSSDPPRPESCRLFMALVNALLVTLIARKIRNDFGVSACLAFSILVVSNIGYLSFGASFWGEVLGGNLLTLAILTVYDKDAGLWRKPITPLVAGVIVGSLFYVRSNHVLLVPLYLCWAILVSSDGSTNVSGFFRSFAKHGALFVIAYAVTVSPWVVANSIKHGRTLTTTTLPISHIVTFGEPDFIHEVMRRADTDSQWFALYRRFSRRARKQGVTYMEAAREGRDQALRNLTLKGYASAVSDNMDRYFRNHTEFLTRFFILYRERTGSGRPVTRAVVFAVTGIGWRILLFLGVATALWVFKPDDSHIRLILLLKGAVFIYSVQPFMAYAHGRYYVQLVPVLALIAALLVSRAIRSRDGKPSTAENHRLPTQVLVISSQIVLGLFAAISVILALT